MVLHELLDGGVILVAHALCLLRGIGADELLCALGREVVVDRCEDGKHLAAGQGTVIAHGLDH